MENRVTNDNQILNNRPPGLKEDFGIRTENDEFAEEIMPDDVEINNMNESEAVQSINDSINESYEVNPDHKQKLKPQQSSVTDNQK